jgi:hypothetical protein
MEATSDRKAKLAEFRKKKERMFRNKDHQHIAHKMVYIAKTAMRELKVQKSVNNSVTLDMVKMNIKNDPHLAMMLTMLKEN